MDIRIHGTLYKLKSEPDDVIFKVMIKQEGIKLKDLFVKTKQGANQYLTSIGKGILADYEKYEQVYANSIIADGYQEAQIRTKEYVIIPD